MAHHDRVDMDIAMFQGRLIGGAEEALENLVKADRDFSSLISALESDWTTSGSKPKIDQYKRFQDNEFRALINTVKEDVRKFQEVCRLMKQADQI